MDIKSILELALVALMLIGFGGIMYNRKQTGRGIGARVIQLMAVVFVFPTITILALEGKIPSDALVTLFGTLIGYLLSGVGRIENSN